MENIIELRVKGNPGVGKTILTKVIASALHNAGFKVDVTDPDVAIAVMQEEDLETPQIENLKKHTKIIITQEQTLRKEREKWLIPDDIKHKIRGQKYSNV